MSQSIKELLHKDLVTAMKNRDSSTTATLRMVLSAITNAEVAGESARELSDTEVLSILTHESKKRKEAAEVFAAAKRTDLAQKEQSEAAIIANYLPTPLTTMQLELLIQTTVKDLNVTGLQNMGKVMKELQPKVANRADGKQVADLVRQELGKN